MNSCWDFLQSPDLFKHRSRISDLIPKHSYLSQGPHTHSDFRAACQHHSQLTHILQLPCNHLKSAFTMRKLPVVGFITWLTLLYLSELAGFTWTCEEVSVNAVGHRCTVIADHYDMDKDRPAFIAVRDSAIAWNCIWSHIVQWYLPVVSSDRFNIRTLSHPKHF